MLIIYIYPWKCDGFEPFFEISCTILLSVCTKMKLNENIICIYIYIKIDTILFPTGKYHI